MKVEFYGENLRRRSISWDFYLDGTFRKVPSGLSSETIRAKAQKQNEIKGNLDRLKLIYTETVLQYLC